MRYLPLLILLTSCQATLSRLLKGTPSLALPSGPSVYMEGLPLPPNLGAELDVVHAAALQICPPAKRPALDALWPTILITWHPGPFDCGGRTVNGCQPLAYAVDVDEVAALPDEIGHLVFEICEGTTGEIELADGGAEYSAAFAAWVGATRVAMLDGGA